MKFVHPLVILIVVSVLSAAQAASAQRYKSDNWFPVLVDGKAGYIDKSGNIVLEPQYDGASYFSEGLARISVGRDTIITQGFSQGFIDETGKVVIKPQWDVVSHFSDGLAAVGYDQTKKKFEINGRTLYTSASHTWYRWGFIDRSGKQVIDTKFSDVSEFRDGIAVAAVPVMSEWKYGFIDRNGDWIIRPQFEHASQFSGGYAVVFVNGKYGYIDRSGVVVVKPTLSFATDFSEGLACVNLRGDVIRPVGMSATRNNGEYAFIDHKGKVRFRVGPDRCYPFSDGFARVSVGGGHRVIDKTGKLVFDSSIDIWSDFSDGLAEVYLRGNEVGFVNTAGEIVIRKKFGKADDFYRGLAEVCESYDFGAKCGYIDRTGKVIWEPSK